MNRYVFRGRYYTANELSEISGVAPATIRDRIRRGYSVEEAIKLAATHDSVREFGEASYWKDWIGMSTMDLYQIYWRWCVSHKYTPLQPKGVTRQLMAVYPVLKIVPTKTVNGYCRIIREKEYET